jgi:hypothetical protein
LAAGTFERYRELIDAGAECSTIQNRVPPSDGWPIGCSVE